MTIKVDLHFLQQKAQEFYSNGLATTTRSTYTAGQQRYTTFCREIMVSPTLASEATLTLFASYFATQNISHTTIKVYLSAVQHMHVSARLHNFFNAQLTPHLQLTLKGTQKSQATGQPPRVRLPITLQIMGNIKALYTGQAVLFLHQHHDLGCLLPSLLCLLVSQQIHHPC